MDSINATTLIQFYNQGQRIFQEINVLEDESLEAANLSEAVFEKSFLSSINFQKSILRAVVFRECNLKCSDFRFADLENATIHNCLLEATSFKGSNTNGLIFSENYYYGLTLHQEDFDRNLRNQD